MLRRDYGSRKMSRVSSGQEGLRQNWLEWGGDKRNPNAWACARPLLDPPNQNGTMAKDGWMRQENVLGKIQLFEWCYALAFVFRRAAWLCEGNSLFFNKPQGKCRPLAFCNVVEGILINKIKCKKWFWSQPVESLLGCLLRQRRRQE